MILNYRNWSRLNEQSEDQKEMMRVQKFLNAKGIKDDSGKALKVDGLAGGSTAEAIEKYQASIKAEVDGVWGSDTMSMMSPADKKLYNSL